MIEYQWGIAQLERSVDSGGVITAHYQVEARDEKLFADFHSSQYFTPDPSSDDFIAFEDLTEEIVLGWVKESIGDSKTSEIENELLQKINEQKSRAYKSGLPWRKLDVD
jgi:proteasome lid subunit RPN8/RPN11